jgi:intracellular sulfur oxidation DsrE/DsrF family protein
MAELKLVLHVDQANHWPAAFGNLNNLTRDYPDAEIRVVANGAGIYAFVGQRDLREKLDQFAANGVTFQVCHNALKEHHVEPTALPDFANVVPAGRSSARRICIDQTVITQTSSRVNMTANGLETDSARTLT